MSLLLFYGFDSASAVPSPAPPPVVFVSAFAALIENVDRDAQRLLGGEPVIYQPKGGTAVLITGIFDSVFVLAEGNAHAGVESRGPAVFLRLDDIPSDPELDDPTLTIRGLNYRVVERMPDDVGGIVLVLRLIT